uniref:Uncharacterized protein n=1 Tax=Rhizophora mucronata TaxID=61149 RepID=A0A2P2NV62_RHIMU
MLVQISYFKQITIDLVNYVLIVPLQFYLSEVIHST